MIIALGYNVAQKVVTIFGVTLRTEKRYYARTVLERDTSLLVMASKSRQSGFRFEREVTQAIKDYLNEHKIRGRAYRNKQFKYNIQGCDIVVDSPFTDYYMAIECKSIDTTLPNAPTKLYFGSAFHINKKDNTHQIDNISSYIHDTGRSGHLAVELIGRAKGKKRKQYKAYVLPWWIVKMKFESGLSGIPLEEIRDFPQLTRKGGKYMWLSHLML
jgi:hypothetical protein